MRTAAPAGTFNTYCRKPPLRPHNDHSVGHFVSPITYCSPLSQSGRGDHPLPQGGEGPKLLNLFTQNPQELSSPSSDVRPGKKVTNHSNRIRSGHKNLTSVLQSYPPDCH